MNLSPHWVPHLQSGGVDAVHWSTIGDARAPDDVIMAWAAVNGAVLFTNDLDFGTLLAAAGAARPAYCKFARST